MRILSDLFKQESKEEEHARRFLQTAKYFIRDGKSNLQLPIKFKEAVLDNEFDYWAIFVAIRAVDAGAINKFGITNPLTGKLLSIIIRDFKKLNPHVEANFKYNKLFIDDLVSFGRLGREIGSMDECYGFWILFSLKVITLDYSDPDIKTSSKIIGQWLVNGFINYWESMPSDYNS